MGFQQYFRYIVGGQLYKSQIKPHFVLIIHFSFVHIIRNLVIYLKKLGAVVVVIVWIYNYLCNPCLSPLKL